MTKEEMKEKETALRRSVDVEKYFKECLNGEEAYNAVYELHEHWYWVTDDMGCQTIMSCLAMYEDKREEWALALQRVIEGRKPGMRNYLHEYRNEPIKGSCNCPCTCDKK